MNRLKLLVEKLSNYNRVPLDQKGVTMVEAMIVSALVLIGIGSAAYWGDQYRENNKLGTTQQAILAINSQTQSKFHQVGHYTDLDNAMAEEMKIFPREMVSGSGATLVITNRYNGTVTLRENTGSIYMHDQVWTNIPNDACITLATFAPEKWLTVDVGGTTIDPTADDAMSDAAAACGTTNTITYTSN